MFKRMLEMTRSKRTQKEQRTRTTRRRMQFEMLEDRKVLAAYYWSLGTDGDFNNAAAWTGPNNTNGVPGPGDDASISGNVEVTSSTSNTVNTVNGGRLKITGGTFATNNVMGSSFINGLTIDAPGRLLVNDGYFVVITSEIGGIIEVAPSATFNFRRGQNDLNAGTQLVGTGIFLVTGDTFGGPQVNLFTDVQSPPNLVLESGVLDGPEDLIIGGTLQWNQGGAGGIRMQGSGKTIIQAGATMDIAGGGVVLSERTIENAGSIVLRGTDHFYMQNSAVINNLVTGTIDIQGNKGFDTIWYDGSTIINAGTILKSAGSLDSAILPQLNSTGTIEVQTGNLYTRSGQIAGILKTEENTVLQIGGSSNWMTTEWIGTTSLQGVGTFNLGSGEQRIHNGGATINVPPTTKLQWQSGTVTVPIDATLTINGNISLTNSSDILLRGGGTMRTVGDLSLAGSGGLAVGGDVATNSTPTSISIPSSRYLSFRGDSDIRGTGAGGHIVNSGVIRKLSGLGTSAIEVNLTNNAFVSSSRGTMSLRNTTSNNGRYTAAFGATIRLTDRSDALFTETETLTVSGGGTVGVGVGTVSGDSDGSTIVVPSTSTLQWDSSGLISIPVGATLNFNGNLTTTGSGDRYLAGGGTFAINGTLTHNTTGNLGMFNGGGSPTTLHIPAGSSLVFDVDALIGPGDANGSLINQGTIRKRGGTGVSTIGHIGLNSTGNWIAEQGTLRIASSTGVVNGGQFEILAGAVIDLTGNYNVKYTGTLSGAGAGELRLSGGMMVAEGGGVGLTLNFPVGFFKWTGGTIHTSGLDVHMNNRVLMTGTSNLAISGGGSVNVTGVVDHQTLGNLALLDGSTLRIASTGTYNIRTDGDIVGGGAVIVEGVLRKNGGSGISQIQPALDNEGLVEVRRGTLQMTGNMIDIASSTLVDGNWSVYGTASSTATLTFSVNVTGIGLGSKVTKSGPNSNLPSMASLSNVSGELALIAGATFSTSTNFTNDGIIRLSPTSLLDIGGNYTQTIDGKLYSQMTGTSLGRIRTAGNVTLNGTLIVTHSGAQPPVSSRLTLFENTGSLAIGGTFTGLPQLATVLLNGMTFRLNYATGAGANDAVLIRTV